MEDKNCDIVMKGGITSGVVYPAAVARLAERFRLRGIGGTSAGAIAAAAAAAAQFRAWKGTREGFKRLGDLPTFLGQRNPSGNSNLFSFFQPQRGSRPVFEILVGALETRSGAQAFSKILLRAVRSFPFTAIVGVLPGAILVVLAVTAGVGILKIVCIILGLVLALLGLGVAVLLRLVQSFGSAIPCNYFGFCSGMSESPKEDQKKGPSTGGQALTIWLTKYLNELAGLDPDGIPLTFGQLWQPDLPAGEEASLTDPMLRLEMYTTCLSKGRPFRLPFRSEPAVRENVCYFRVDDFSRFFPANVVKWMEDHPRRSDVQAGIGEKGFLAMPDAWNLPVVVATRMSLSFPILLSSVPLYAYDYQLKMTPEEHEQGNGTQPADTVQMPSRCWFSDGGLCNNFPIDFFDGPIPRWPTFSFNLVDSPEGSSPEDLAHPWMPRNNKEGIQEVWNHLPEGGGFSSLLAFLWSMITTMQNWGDNTLLRLPGYRDRVAHVGLTPEEGGLNLAMPADRIETLSSRGLNAADEFIRRFATNEEPVMNWSNHRWIRFRSMLASLTEMVERVDLTCSQPQPGDQGYEEWVGGIETHKIPSYKWTSAHQRQLGVDTLIALRRLARTWTDVRVDASAGAPKPRPELRPRPRT